MPILNAVEIARKFWSHVDKSGDCWLWTRSLNHGYGQIWINGKRWIASRLSWTLTMGSIPTSRLMVCHLCDNPVCVRPSHLFLADQRDNLSDMREKNRGSSPPIQRGLQNNKTKLTESQVREIRARYIAGESLRALGKVYHVDYTHISSIIRRKTWTYLS